MPNSARNQTSGPTIASFETLDSTNAEALRRATAGETGPVWILAREQTAGRGRRARAWASPPGNLYASLLLTVTGPGSRLSELGMVAGLAIHDAVSDLMAGHEALVALKWPNDLLIDGAKVSGLLIESTGLGTTGPWSLAVGIGINLVDHPADTPWPATDLSCFGVSVSPADAMKRLAGHMARRLGEWDHGNGIEELREVWAARISGIGEPLTVNLNDETLNGRFAALDKDGALVLELGDGTRRRIMAGDVFLPSHDTSRSMRNAQGH